MRNNRDRYGYVHIYILDQEAKTKRFSQCPSVRPQNISTLKLNTGWSKLSAVFFVSESYIPGIKNANISTRTYVDLRR